MKRLLLILCVLCNTTLILADRIDSLDFGEKLAVFKVLIMEKKLILNKEDVIEFNNSPDYKEMTMIGFGKCEYEGMDYNSGIISLLRGKVIGVMLFADFPIDDITDSETAKLMAEVHMDLVARGYIRKNKEQGGGITCYSFFNSEWNVISFIIMSKSGDKYFLAYTIIK